MGHQANQLSAEHSDETMQAEIPPFKGLYKVEFETPRGKAFGVIHADDGKIRGGSSAFAYVGTYTQDGHSLSGNVSSLRHTPDLEHPSVFGFDEVTIAFQGAIKGNYAICDGTAAESPSLNFKAVLTRVAD